MGSQIVRLCKQIQLTVRLENYEYILIHAPKIQI